MDYYEYHKEIVNNNEAKDFYKQANFIGYILPNGELLRCKEHNVEGLCTAFLLDLQLVINHPNDKEKYLGSDKDDLFGKLVGDYLWKIGAEEAQKLYDFIMKNKLEFKDIMVRILGCHLVTRLNKIIITSLTDYTKFYNYLLMGFKLEYIPGVVYKDNDFQFNSVEIKKNDFLMDEINEIRNDVDGENLNSFFRK